MIAAMASRKKTSEDEIKTLLSAEEDAPLASEDNSFTIDASGPSDLGTQDVDAWVKASGWTPVEFLTHTYRNPWQKMPDRISAAKAILDYTHRKLPARIEVENSGTVGIAKLDASALSKLSAKELETLEKILEKAGDSE